MVSIAFWPILAFFVVWKITWSSSKKTAERKLNGRGAYLLLFIIGMFLLILSTLVSVSNIPIFNIPLYYASPLIQATGFIIEILGLLIATWARLTIGSNWSSDVQFKEHHKLITNGPYRTVRHPIYTGITVLFLGAAIYLGLLAGFLAVLSIFYSFVIKYKQEEAMMAKHFPKEYSGYMKRTKAIIPFIY